MILQPRDESLLRTLSRYGVLSTRQISRHSFLGISHTTMMRRLRLLEENDFIVRIKGLDEGLSAWRTGSVGARQVGEELPFRYSNQNQTLHDVTLSEVRIRLESLGYASDWTGELTVKRQQGARNFKSQVNERVIPDGIFTALYRDTPCVIAAELELHAKAKVRYEKLLKQYAAKTAIDFVWYIVRTPSIGALISDTWQSIPSYLKSENTPSLGYTLLDDVLTNSTEMKLHRPQGREEIRFREVFAPPVEVSPAESPGSVSSEIQFAPPDQTPAQPMSIENIQSV